MMWNDYTYDSTKIGVEPTERVYTVGVLTMKHVFEASGITNVSDIQLVLDAVETALIKLCENCMFETIKARKMDARKSPDRVIEVNILNLLIGELETASKRTGKPVTDVQVIDAIKKLIKSNLDTMAIGGQSQKLVRENEILSLLLPKQLTEDEIREIISSNNLVGIPSVMQYLNTHYAGSFDKSLASKIARG